MDEFTGQTNIFMMVNFDKDPYAHEAENARARKLEILPTFT